MAETSEKQAESGKAESDVCFGCVVVPQFAAQAGVRLRPQLANIPVAVMEGKRPQERVYSLNRVAKRLCLASGMTRIEVETFGGVEVLARSVAEEDAARALLADAMRAFSPRIEPRLDSVDWECVLDLSGTERLLGDSASIGRQLVLRIEALGFYGAIVVSANADAGLLVGRDMAWGMSADTISPGLLPSAVVGHPAVLVVTPGSEANALAGLSLAVLNLDEDVAERFEVWGIITLGELAALPETALIARMGQAGKQLRMRSRGEMLHLLEPVVEELQLEEKLELESVAETLEPLLFILNPMLENLCIRAMGRALAIAAITVQFGLKDTYTLTHEDAVNVEDYVRTVRPGIPTLDRKLLLKMLQLDLEAHPAPSSVWRITVRAEPGMTSRIQLGLFAPQTPEPTRFEDTHARLLSVVGEGNVGRVRLIDTHASDAFVLERFHLLMNAYKPPAVCEAGRRPQTALRRMHPPMMVYVEMVEAQIRRFWLETRAYEVFRCFGPWHSSGDWWCGQVWTVDSWDVAARDGEGELLLCLVGYDHVKQAWLLQGIYD